MTKQRSRRAATWRATLAAAILVAGLVAWWWWPVAQDAPGDAPGGSVASSPNTTASTTTGMAGSPALASVADTKSSSPSSANQRGAGTAPEQLNFELCGIGPVPIRRPSAAKVAEVFELLPRPLGLDARAEAWTRVTQTLDASPADRDRAAALVLRASGLLDAEATLSTLTRRPDTAPYVRQLARLARQTRDAGVLQWALSVCERERTMPECQALSAHELVKLDPEDGRSWLLLAAADAGRRDESLRRAAMAPVMGVMPSLSQPVVSVGAAGLPPYLLQELLVQAIGVQAAMVDGALYRAIDHCRKAADGERRATCLTLADALAERGRDVVTMAVGRSIGSRSGWSAARVDASKAEERNLIERMPLQEEAQPWSCRAVETTVQWVADSDRLGERAALQMRSAKATASAPSR